MKLKPVKIKVQDMYSGGITKFYVDTEEELDSAFDMIKKKMR